jgi:hypothetical protein
MSARYKFIDNEGVYFTTSTVAGWTDVFTREIYKKILLDSIRHCQQSQGLKIHAWFLRPKISNREDTGRSPAPVGWSPAPVGRKKN